jgi:hypothetical protein
MRGKWLIALIAGAAIIPIIVFASVRGDLLKMGINSDTASITVTKDITAGEDVVATGDVTSGDDTIVGDDCTIAGLATVGETLGVTGAVTNSSTLHTVGNETTSGTLTVTGATALRSTLGVTGAATLSSTLDVTGVTTITGVFDANSTATLSVLGEHKERILPFDVTASITAAMSGAIITNKDAASSTVLTLPTAAAGLTYTFLDIEAAAGSDLWITASSGDKINGGTAAKSYKCTGDAVKQTVTIVAIDAENWEITAEQGTWSNDNN